LEFGKVKKGQGKGIGEKFGPSKFGVRLGGKTYWQLFHSWLRGAFCGILGTTFQKALFFPRKERLRFGKEGRVLKKFWPGEGLLVIFLPNNKVFLKLILGGLIKGWRVKVIY